MESVACIFCQKPNHNVAITENGYYGRRCVNCGLIYISPRPSPSETAQLYTEGHAALYADAQLHFGRFKEKEASETIKIIKKFKSNGTILELGPGGGAFLKTAREFGFTPYAIELNPIEATWIGQDLKIPCESVALNHKSFNGKKFDVVYHRDVLSHLYDPINTFELINQSLKQKGLVIFETGNIADINPRYLRLFSQFLYPDHLYFFGENSVQLLLERTGFECLKIYRNSIVVSLLLQKALWNLKDRLKDGHSLSAMRQLHAASDTVKTRFSAKRRLRLLYRYTSYYIEKLGGVFPKNTWPLKLLVVAEKRS
jgi:2-polyprenyl-3-methyl-5-hydroxy-6-metoxy-1,4-benzoquinol methylase